MEKTKAYEKYPVNSILLSNGVSNAIYLIGAFILFGFGWAVSIIYLIYCALIEYRVIEHSCVNCYYYGKRCFSGKGLCAAKIFKRGNPKGFQARKITWFDILPDFFVSIIPIAGGAILLSINFDWAILAAVVVIGILGFLVQGFLRGSVTCKHCKQKELGCSAEQMFTKKKSKKDKLNPGKKSKK